MISVRRERVKERFKAYNSLQLTEIVCKQIFVITTYYIIYDHKRNVILLYYHNTDLI